MIIYRLSLYEFSNKYKSYMGINKVYNHANSKGKTNYIYNSNEIYINCPYILEKIPYYINSPYVYRNIEIPNDFNVLLSNGLEKKPISYKHNFIGSHYIPNRPLGALTNNIYLPKSVEPIYTIEKQEITIEYIDTFFIDKPNFNIGIPISLSFVSKKTLVSLPDHTTEMDIVIYNIYQSKLFTSIRWKPIGNNKINIAKKNIVSIDLTNLLGNNVIDKYNNIEIYYS